jgi:hypothetical protein
VSGGTYRVSPDVRRIKAIIARLTVRILDVGRSTLYRPARGFDSAKPFLLRRIAPALSRGPWGFHNLEVLYQSQALANKLNILDHPLTTSFTPNTEPVVLVFSSRVRKAMIWKNKTKTHLKRTTLEMR